MLVYTQLSLWYSCLPTRDGQAELTWVAGYIIEMVCPPEDGHPSRY